MSDDVREKLKRLLVDQMQYQLDPADIKDETFLVGKGLALSSVDLVTLVIKLEDAFEVFFEAEEVSPATQSFGSLASTIERKLEEEGGSY